MDGHVDGWMDGRTDRQGMCKQIHGCIDRRMGECVRQFQRAPRILRKFRFTATFKYWVSLDFFGKQSVPWLEPTLMPLV